MTKPPSMTAFLALLATLLTTSASCDGGDPTLIASDTGLEWQRSPAPGSYEQAEGVAYCEDLVLAGASDWRLPSVWEIRTLTDPARVDPAYADESFPGVVDTFWTSTLRAGESNRAWLASTWDGSDACAIRAGVGSEHAIRCVRGSALPEPVFVDGTDGTVTDTRSGLVWQRSVDDTSRTFVNASAYCASLVLGDAPTGAWRLPTLQELRSTTSVTTHTPATSIGHFPFTPSVAFWTSTPFAGPGGQIWVVQLDYGESGHGDPGNGARVRCVR